MYIGKNIKYLRKRDKINQTVLAEQLGKTHVTIGDYEKGKSKPPIDILVKICEIFDVDLNSLVHVDIEKDGVIFDNMSQEELDKHYVETQAKLEILRQKYREKFNLEPGEDPDPELLKSFTPEQIAALKVLIQLETKFKNF